jgi:hypothetical protein
MGVTVTVRTTHEATIVTLTGAGSGEVLPSIADGIVALAEDSPLLIVDLSGIFLSEPGAVRAFVATVADAPVAVKLVCDRLSGRTLLNSCALVSRPPTFSCLADALADATPSSLALAASG